MKLDDFFPQIFFRAKLGKTTVVRNQRYIASRKEVRALLNACRKHLSRFPTEAEIDEANQAIDERCQRAWDSRTLPATRDKRCGFIYLAKNHRNGFVKIGHSQNPHFREATLQSEEPDVSLIFVTIGSLADEARLHRKYANARLRGEWFRLSGSDVEEIKARF